MVIKNAVVGMCLLLLLGSLGCSRQQSDWEKTRAANTPDSYEQFLKKYPSGEFTAQAQARVKELYEERDWQKARDADTLEAYQAFLKQYPEGKSTEEARIRVENFSLAQAPSNANPGQDAAIPPGNTPASAAGGSAAPAPGIPPRATSPAVTPAAAKPANPVKTATNAAAAAATAATAATVAKSTSGSHGTSGSSGSYGIQLGAFKGSVDSAKRRWTQLMKEYPKQLSGLSPTVSPKKGQSETLYRLQTLGLSEKHARAICRELKAKAQACVLVPPAHR